MARRATIQLEVHRQIVQSIPLDDAEIECLIQERSGKDFDHAGHQRTPAETLVRDDGGQHVGIVAVDHDSQGYH